MTIRAENLTLKGAGSAVLDGSRRDALVIAGAHGVTLADFDVRNGLNGSSAVVTNTVTRENGLHGLDLQTGSSATITGTFTSAGNRVFGINVNGSSLTFSRAAATATRNALGVQVATGANAFLNDSDTVLEVADNFATGLTVVSGAHMVSFGGTINATGNGVFGVSVNSKEASISMPARC